MEPVGFVGIIKLTTQIIYRNSKHFLCIAVILALPAALEALLLDTSGSFRLLLSTISYLYKLLFSEGGKVPPPVIDPSILDGGPQAHAHKVVLEVVVAAFALAMALAYTPLLTFSACRACLGKRVDMRGSARGIGKSVGKLVVTSLCLVAAMVVAGAAAALVGMVAVVVGTAVGGGTAGAVISVAGVLVSWAGVVYLAVGLNLAGTVSIVEEARGWEAMTRSMRLVGQRIGATLGLVLLFGMGGLLLLPVLASQSRWIALGLGLPLTALLSLFTMVARVVLYMSCRAGLREPLDSLLPSSAHFGPLDSSHAKYLDLETASLATQSS